MEEIMLNKVRENKRNIPLSLSVDRDYQNENNLRLKYEIKHDHHQFKIIKKTKNNKIKGL